MKSIVAMLIGMAFMLSVSAEPLFAKGGGGGKGAGQGGGQGAGISQKSGECDQKQEKKQKREKKQKKEKKQKDKKNKNQSKNVNQGDTKNQERVSTGDGKGQMINNKVQTENAGDSTQVKTQEKEKTSSGAVVPINKNANPDK